LGRRWHCEFWDANAEKMLPGWLSFDDAELLYTLARRGRAFVGGGIGVKFGFFNAIGAGRGSVFLTLSETQFHALVAACETKMARTSPLHDDK